MMQAPTIRHAALFLFGIAAACSTTADTLPSLRAECEYVPLSPKELGPRVDVPVALENELPVRATQRILQWLPNDAMRMRVLDTSEGASASYGVNSIGRAGSSYSVLFDYIKYRTMFVPLAIEIKTQTGAPTDRGIEESLEIEVRGQSAHQVFRVKRPSGLVWGIQDVGRTISGVTVCIGVGMRIRTDITVLSGTVSLDLVGLGAAAAERRVRGSMYVQTLGLSGRSVTPLLPVPDELSRSSVAAALQALATIKSRIYDDNVDIVPQIIGYESPLDLIGLEYAIVSEMQFLGLSALRDPMNLPIAMPPNEVITKLEVDTAPHLCERRRLCTDPITTGK